MAVGLIQVQIVHL